MVSLIGESMSAQFPDLLEYQGTRYALCSLPMDVCPLVRINRYELHCNTALVRGYVAEWRVEAGRLYLIGISGAFDDRALTPISIRTYFPDAVLPIFASWYSGQLRCPGGRRLKYVHMGFKSIYQRDLLITIDQGRVVAAQWQENSVKPSPKKMSVPDFLICRGGRDEG